MHLRDVVKAGVLDCKDRYSCFDLRISYYNCMAPGYMYMETIGGIDDKVLGRVYSHLRELCSSSRARAVIATTGLNDLIAEADEIGKNEKVDQSKDFPSLIGHLAVHLRNQEWSQKKTQMSVQERTLLHSVFYLTAIAIVESETVEASLHQQLLPALVRVWLGMIRTVSSWFYLANRATYDWPRNLWTIVTEYFGTEEPLLMSRSLMLLAVTIRIYFPLSNEMETGDHLAGKEIYLNLKFVEVDESVFGVVGFDLRREADLPLLILDALDMEESVAGADWGRKYGLFICKSIFRFSSCRIETDPYTFQTGVEDFDEDDSRRLFIWPSEQRSAWMGVWTNFFLLWETMQEPQLHLVQPMLPLLQTFLQPYRPDEPWLGLAWWESILRRAFANDSVAVRKAVLEALLDLPVERLVRLRRAVDFLFGPMMRLLDNSHLYANIDVNLMVSQFGERMARFYARLIDSFEDLEARKTCLSFYLGQVAKTIKSPTPAIFLVQAMVQVEAFPAFGDEQLSVIGGLADNHTLFHNPRARSLVRWQLLQVLLRFANGSAISYQVLASTLDRLLEGNGELTLGSELFRSIQDWLFVTFNANYIASNLETEISRYFYLYTSNSFDETQQIAKRISTMAIFALNDSDAHRSNVSASSTNMQTCLKAAYANMAKMIDSGSSSSFIVSSVMLFRRLDEAVRRVTGGSRDLVEGLGLGGRLFEWMEVVTRVALADVLSEFPQFRRSSEPLINSNHVSQVQGDCEPQLDLQALSELVDGLEVFVRAAAGAATSDEAVRANLVKYLDMQLFQLVSMLRHYTHLRNSQSAETYVMQLGKVTMLRMMSQCFDHLGTLPGHVDFFQNAEILQLYEFDLERAPMQSAEEWPRVQVSFVAAKWKAVASIVRFVARTPDLTSLISTDEAFSLALEQLEVSQHAAVISIYECLRVLAESPSLSASLVELAVKVSIELLSGGPSGAPRWFDLYCEAFLGFLFQPCLLGRMDCAEGVRSAFEHILHRVGPRRRGLVTRMVARLWSYWRSPEGRISRDSCTDDIVQLIIFGPIRDTNEERLAETLTFSRHKGQIGKPEEQECTVDSADMDQDYLVRVYINDLINHLDPQCPFDRAFAGLLSEKLLDRSLGVGLSKAELKHVFPNALLHRRRMRCWQSMLLLSAVLYPSSDQHAAPIGMAQQMQTMMGRLWECVRREALPSTRYYAEWYLIRGYLRYPEYTVDLLGRLEEDFDLPASLAISIMTVILHVGMKLPSVMPKGKAKIRMCFNFGTDTQSIEFLWRFYDRAFELILPFVMHNSHTCRVHAIFVFDALWGVAAELEPSRPLAPVYQRMSRHIRQSDHCQRFIGKLWEEPMLAGLDPLGDFDLQFVFCDFPRAIGMASDELITSVIPFKGLCLFPPSVDVLF